MICPIENMVIKMCSFHILLLKLGVVEAEGEFNGIL
jgi:hypothetical protein